MYSHKQQMEKLSLKKLIYQHILTKIDLLKIRSIKRKCN